MTMKLLVVLFPVMAVLPQVILSGVLLCPKLLIQTSVLAMTMELLVELFPPKLVIQLSLLTATLELL
jgi:hypothetical protein